MLSNSESESFYTLESLMEKCKKEKNEKILKIIAPYIEKIRNLSNDIKKKENLILYSNLKINKIKDEYDELTKELLEEENNLIETYISAIEKEEFYLSPANLEIKELAERARDKKLKYSKMINNYDNDKLYMDKREQELQDRINSLPENEHNLFLILKEYILNDKDINKIKNDLELLSDDNNNKYDDIIRENKPFIKETKNKMKDKKNEINDARDEINNNYEKRARKSMNHINFNNNMSIIKTHRDENDNSNNNSILDNSSNNSFLFNNSELNKTNSSIQNNKLTNVNKTYYLKTNKPFYNKQFSNKSGSINNGSNNTFKIKNNSNILNTDSSDKININNKNNKRKDVYICKRLLKNYCNKYNDKNNNKFMLDLKMKEKKKNQSVPKSLYEQRRIIREGLNDYIYVNGNRYKQSLIGKATNTVNGVY